MKALIYERITNKKQIMNFTPDQELQTWAVNLIIVKLEGIRNYECAADRQNQITLYKIPDI